MRAVLLILILGVVALIAAISLGLVDFTQTRGAKPPTLQAEDGTIRAVPGQTPAFEVETGTVGVGSRETNVVAAVGPVRGQTTVAVPTVEVRRPADAEANTAQ